MHFIFSCRVFGVFRQGSARHVSRAVLEASQRTQITPNQTPSPGTPFMTTLAALESQISPAIVGPDCESSDSLARAFRVSVAALRTIVQQKLFKPKYKSQKEYASKRWNLKDRVYLHRLVSAAKVLEVRGTRQETRTSLVQRYLNLAVAVSELAWNQSITSK